MVDEEGIQEVGVVGPEIEEEEEEEEEEGIQKADDGVQGNEGVHVADKQLVTQTGICAAKAALCKKSDTTVNAVEQELTTLTVECAAKLACTSRDPGMHAVEVTFIKLADITSAAITPMYDP